MQIKGDRKGLRVDFSREGGYTAMVGHDIESRITLKEKIWKSSAVLW